MSLSQSEKTKMLREEVSKRFNEILSPSANFFKQKFKMLKARSIQDICFILMDFIGKKCERVFYKFIDCAFYHLDLFWPEVVKELNRMIVIQDSKGNAYEVRLIDQDWALRANGSFENRAEHLKRKSKRKEKTPFAKILEKIKAYPTTEEIIEKNSRVESSSSSNDVGTQTSIKEEDLIQNTLLDEGQDYEMSYYNLEPEYF